MNALFPLKHWGLTLLIAGIVTHLSVYIYPGNFPVGPFDLFGTQLELSILLSLPALVIYYVLFFALKTTALSTRQIQILLILCAITSILITFKFMDILNERRLVVTYVFACFMSGMALMLLEKTKHSDSKPQTS